jgi:hypothetical protein
MTNEETSRNQAQEKTLAALYGALTYLDMKSELDVEGLISQPLAHIHHTGRRTGPPDICTHGEI